MPDVTFGGGMAMFVPMPLPNAAALLGGCIPGALVVNGVDVTTFVFGRPRSDPRLLSGSGASEAAAICCAPGAGLIPMPMPPLPAAALLGGCMPMPVLMPMPTPPTPPAIAFGGCMPMPMPPPTAVALLGGCIPMPVPMPIPVLMPMPAPPAMAFGGCILMPLDIPTAWPPIPNTLGAEYLAGPITPPV